MWVAFTLDYQYIMLYILDFNDQPVRKLKAVHVVEGVMFMEG
jgi:hypothetical protein